VYQDFEDIVRRLNSTIGDPDLARLFENAYLNTLDTVVDERDMLQTTLRKS
jgi:meiotically up-regulated gene 157 (Mug157) protein